MRAQIGKIVKSVAAAFSVRILLAVLAACFSAVAQSPAPAPAVVAQLSQSNTKNASVEPPVSVCRRPLPRWAGSRNWFLKALNVLFVHHLHHSYISFAADTFIPSLGASVRTLGVHPIEPGNHNKQPIADQESDKGGECKIVADATAEKVKRLAEEIAAGTCYSCGKDYHNSALIGCYNNSNTYVYDLIRGAGMTPPPMGGAPGYRRHHTCRI